MSIRHPRFRQFAACWLAVLLVLGCRRAASLRPVATVNQEPVAAAELLAALPWHIDTLVGEEEIKRRVLEGLIDKELLVQEARKLGLEDEVATQLEFDKKGLVTQELYNSVVAPGNRLTELELASAHKLLQTEVWVKLIEVESESLAARLRAELDAGAEFETLARAHSVHRSRLQGGDLGYRPELVFDEPARLPSRGAVAGPIAVAGNFQILKLVDRRLADPQPPPLSEMRAELEARLAQQRRASLANQYLAELRSRLKYNPPGLDILCRPVDSITEAEKEIWVAVRDDKKYVKVARLLHIARRFTPALDTAMRKYTLRREIEEDLIYEDALNRGLDRLPAVEARLKARQEELLYEAICKREVNDRVLVSDEEVRAYYDAHRGDFPAPESGPVESTLLGSRDPTRGERGSPVAGLIRNRLQTEGRGRRLTDYRDSLRGQARIEINEKVLKSVHLDREAARREEEPR